MQALRRNAIRALAVALFLFSAFLVWVFYDLPSIRALPENLRQPSVRITDRDGQLLYEAIPAEGRHAALAAENIPLCLKEATIAVEDKTFYQNPGVDVWGILRAAWINLQGGETLAGGSSLTQQVARNLLLRDEISQRTLRRKLRETVLALQLSRAYSKDEILALYLNQTYYGGMAYGIEAAAQTYFGKPASKLLLHECALLAGLPQLPGAYNPFTHPDLARERQRVVLGLMEKNGFITAEERRAAEDAPLSYNPAPYPIEAPHFVWMVKDELDKLYTAGVLDTSQSLVVRSALDLEMQHTVEEIVRRRIESFKPKAGETGRNVNNAAVVVLNPQSGEVLALVGSADYFDSSIDGAVNMAITPRQSGSAFKPIVYAAAFDPRRAKPFTAATSILDVSTTFQTKDNQPYIPVNFDKKEHGFVSAREALASSLNIPAVLTLQDVGIEAAATLAKQLGIESLGAPQEYDLSLALGGGEMSLLELSSAYAAFPNRGMIAPRVLILEIRDADGNLLYAPPQQPARQVLDPRVAWLICDILSDDRARLIGFGANSVLKIDRTAAVKTGTTTNFHDNWTIGFTPDLLVGVWVGNSDYRPMRDVSGVTGAAPIWHETIRALSQGKPDRPFERPAGLIQMDVCALSGLLPTPLCPQTKTEWFIEGTQPKEYDTFYKQTESGELALDLPLQAQPFALRQGWTLWRDSSAADLILLSPLDSSVYRLAPARDLSSQQILLSALADSNFIQVTFYADGVPLAAFSQPPFETWWALSLGEHRFWAEGRTADGRVVQTAPAKITVIP